ncbi:Hsp20 family protein [bacterium]|nr:Hsp20 family protein [bacterium]
MAEATVPKVQEQQNVTPHESTRSQTRYYYPPVDIFDHEKELVVIADVPGTDKDNVDVKVEEGVLTIEAKPPVEEQNNLIYREFEWGHFFRQFELSEEINVENISAELKNGVLTLHLPKMEKPSKSIEVKVA